MIAAVEQLEEGRSPTPAHAREKSRRFSLTSSTGALRRRLKSVYDLGLEEQSGLGRAIAPAVQIVKPVPLPPDAGLEKPKGWDKVVIHPASPTKAYYDIFIIVCVLYTSVAAPVKVCYKTDFWEGMDVGLDIIFILDIFVQFISGYFDMGGAAFPVLQLRKVIIRYLRTWFLIDLVAGVPLDRFIASLSWVGLVKVVRLLKIRRILSKYENLAWGPLIKVLTILSFWLLSAHWISCGFFAIGWNTCNTYSETWVALYWPDLLLTCREKKKPEEGLHLITSMAGLPLTNPISLFGMHVRVMYWALATMSSMGYGNAPRARTDLEYCYAMFAQVTGSCLAAAIFSNIAQMINKGDAAGARYQAQLDKVRKLSHLLHALHRDMIVT